MLLSGTAHVGKKALWDADLAALLSCLYLVVPHRCPSITSQELPAYKDLLRLFF
jgi:hypothetical protein